VNVTYSELLISSKYEKAVRESDKDRWIGRYTYIPSRKIDGWTDRRITDKLMDG